MSVHDDSSATEILYAEALLFNFKFEGLMTTVEAIGMQLELAQQAEYWFMAET